MTTDSRQHIEIPPGLILDQEIFGQLLELEADDPGFLKGLVGGYIEQAEKTFALMNSALEAHPLRAQKSSSLEELSKLGHFLKGSSAALGLKGLASICEQIQHFGRGATPQGAPLSSPLALQAISEAIPRARSQFSLASSFLSQF